MFDYDHYQPRGDKKNSDFFYEYLQKIYDWRKTQGLNDMLGNMSAIMVQVETGDALGYINELYMMTPYRLVKSYLNATHKIFVLKNLDDTPVFFVLEPLSKAYADKNTHLNNLFPIAREKVNARFIGEVYHTENINETVKLLDSHSIRLHMPDPNFNTLLNNRYFAFTEPSDYTHNRFAYTEHDFRDLDTLHLGEKFQLTDEELAELNQSEHIFLDKGLDKLILGIDHLATRILSSDRECAILEFLTCADYYYWGAYNIWEMNSSTNVARRPGVSSDTKSPAKVFTANNTPYFVNAFSNTPMPTEDFVRNLGPRMHHIAYEVLDGDYDDEQKNIDYVVGVIKGEQVKFLERIFGECKDRPDLKQIFSKRSVYSMLITEYIERCHHFDGFFTRENVAELTQAAGRDETVADNIEKHGGVFD